MGTNIQTGTTRIYDNVRMGANCVIGDFVILGEPPRGVAPGALELVIGDNCIIRSHTVIYAGNRIGNNFQTGHHAFLREQNQIGDDVSIGTMSMIEHHVTVGNGVRIHSQVFIPEFCVLEDGCWVGPDVVLTNARYPNAPQTKKHLKGVTLRKRCRVGANATLLPGVEIGEDALVGAGCVVRKNVDAGTMVVGNPARVLGSVADLRYEDGELVYPNTKGNG